MKMKSPGLKDEKKFQEGATQLQLDKDTAEAVHFYQDRARRAYEQREKNWEYFDGLTYYHDYLLNRQAANTYLRPKKNDDEVRVNTGVTEKKIEVVLNQLKQLNLESQIRAFDKNDNLLVDLGEQFTDIVLRSKQIEKDEDFWPEAYHELLTQRSVFIEERWVDIEAKDKRLQKAGMRRIQKAEKRLLSGLKVFLGDITIPWYRFDDQPYIVIYDRVHYKEAQAEFGNDKDWKHVQQGNAQTNGGIFSFRYGELEMDEVEILRYISFKDDEEAYMVQGVPMTSKSGKLSWEHDGYKIKQFSLKSMSRDFSYGKPLTASAKTMQALDNESLRLMVRKWRQALEPPIGVKGGKIFSKDIWSPAAMTQGVKADDFERLIDHDGITQSEFNMIEFIEKKTEEFIGAGGQQQGLGNEGSQTLGETRILQKEFVTNLGLAVGACMAMHRDMDLLRLYNLLENATKPIGKGNDPFTNEVVDVYRQYTRDEADLGSGKVGQKKILFMDRDITEDEQNMIFDKEKEQEKLGRDIRYFTININKLRAIPLIWYSSVTQGFQDTEQIDQLLFKDAFDQALLLSKTAGRPLAGDAIIEDFGQLWKRRDWFQKAAPKTIMPPEDLMDVEGSDIGSDMKPNRENKPTVNTMESNTPSL